MTEWWRSMRATLRLLGRRADSSCGRSSWPAASRRSRPRSPPRGTSPMATSTSPPSPPWWRPLCPTPEVGSFFAGAIVMAWATGADTPAVGPAVTVTALALLAGHVAGALAAAMPPTAAADLQLTLRWWRPTAVIAAGTVATAVLVAGLDAWSPPGSIAVVLAALVVAGVAVWRWSAGGRRVAGDAIGRVRPSRGERGITGLRGRSPPPMVRGPGWSRSHPRPSVPAVLALFFTTTGYRIVGLLHILAAIAAFGPLFIYPSMQRAGATTAVARLHLRLVLPALDPVVGARHGVGRDVQARRLGRSGLQDVPDVDRPGPDRVGDPDGRQLVPDPPCAARHRRVSAEPDGSRRSASPTCC